MAKHTALTPTSQKLIAAFAASGLVGTGLAVPIGQAAFGDVACDLNFTNQDDATKITAIQDALNGCGSTPITIGGIGAGNSVSIVGQGFIVPSSETRIAMSISSDTGFTIVRTSGGGHPLIMVESDALSSDPSEQLLSVESLTVEGLTFEGGRSEYGSAINAPSESQLFIKNSTFLGNRSLYGGGAVYSLGNIMIESSTFSANQVTWESGDYRGGAVYSWGDIYALNSTFVNNSVAATGSNSAGGALYSAKNTGGAFLVHNTFLGNSSTVGDAVSAYGIVHYGNLFAQSGEPADYILAYGAFDVTNTGSEFFAGEASALRLQTTLSQNEAPIGQPQTLALLAGSELIDAVEVGDSELHDSLKEWMDGAFGRTVMPVTVDQRGFSRVGVADAGAFEFGATASDDEPIDNNPSYSPPSTPSATPALEVARKVVPGFGANSIRLTKPMKKEIRAFLKANPNLNNVVCRGYTSAPATVQDRMLARERGKVTCAFIKKLRPEANVTLRSGSHTDKPGLKIRRVQITLR